MTATPAPELVAKPSTGRWLGRSLLAAGIVGCLAVLILCTRSIYTDYVIGTRPILPVIESIDIRLYPESLIEDPTIIATVEFPTKKPEPVPAHAEYSLPEIMAEGEDTVISLAVYLSGVTPEINLRENIKVAGLPNLLVGAKVKPILAANADEFQPLLEGDQERVVRRRPTRWVWHLRPKEVGSYTVALTVTSKRIRETPIFRKPITVERRWSSIWAYIRASPGRALTETCSGVGLLCLTAVGLILERRKR